MTTHKIGTREQWLAARLELLDAEKALTRQSDELAQRRQELPWVRVDKDYRVRHRRGQGVACGPVPGALAAPRLSLHVRAGLQGRLPVLLVDRRRLQRRRRAPRQPRRDALGGVARAACRSCRRSSSGWAGPFPGRPRRAATSTTISTSPSPKSSSARAASNTITAAAATR